MKGYLGAFALTLLVEPPLYALALRALFREQIRRGYPMGLFVNAGSHPLTWLVVFPLAARAVPDVAAFAVAEAFAVAWEVGWLYAWLRRDLALVAAVAFAANGVSLGLGALAQLS